MIPIEKGILHLNDFKARNEMQRTIHNIMILTLILNLIY